MKWASIAMALFAQGALAEEAEWRALYACLEQHKANVAEVVASVDEGADLIVEVLCLNESTAVGNAMMGTRRDVVKDNGSFGAAFSAFLVVMKREMRLAIYEQKLVQR